MRCGWSCSRQSRIYSIGENGPTHRRRARVRVLREHDVQTAHPSSCLDCSWQVSLAPGYWIKYWHARVAVASGSFSDKSIVVVSSTSTCAIFGTSQVQGVESSVARSLKVLGSARYLLFYFHGFVGEPQKRHVLQPPFQLRISVDFVSQRLTGNPFDFACPHSYEDQLNGLSFLRILR